ncbi:type II toxin-antitoxin system RelE/ParE family toxin [Patescibacteria group bacterium]|nr:type II toxin-antitoxin system RelE/ParE family toxin [Patescibacteria group bacterium]MBU4368114.1 type II toxin-antitoxin system RelE/ParE family toxin [Patescibacteria group bacterium]
MNILPLSKRLLKYLKAHNLAVRFEKQKLIFEANPFYPSLHTEILEPKHLKIYSFRVNQQYRAIFIYRNDGDIEIIDINDHYQ